MRNVKDDNHDPAEQPEAEAEGKPAIAKRVNPHPPIDVGQHISAFPNATGPVPISLNIAGTPGAAPALHHNMLWSVGEWLKGLESDAEGVFKVAEADLVDLYHWLAKHLGFENAATPHPAPPAPAAAAAEAAKPAAE